MSKVLIILVNYNNSSDTINCIESILLSDYLEYKIIIVDNNSSDNSFNEFKNWSIKHNNNNILFTKSPVNKGFAYGNNYAISYANNKSIIYDYVWFLNNDTIIENDTLSYFVNRMNYEIAINSKTGILGGKLLYYYKRNVLQGVGSIYNKYLAASKPIGGNEIDSGQFDIFAIKMDYVIGASMFVNKAYITDIGLMNEEYFLYFEELDWILRGKNKGWKVAYEYKARVYHKEGGSTTNSNKVMSLIADESQVRNRLIFTYKFYKPYLITVIPVIYVSVINRILRGQFSRAIHIFRVINRTILNLGKN